ncbi:serine/threonine protein kinase [Nodularia spumigena CENA596]|uniref:Serine/threonine protein kinase n=1 Tax=Nodularia spumigena CENA596 TaxID=1819295 RepID=A0A166KZ21_NODSP|nr:trypsin-like peptidase domain-containing protein [Nodularia spumigena]KZL51710.1 serine/threonine protein kinase [Nodularia spumigena CENA596]
MKFSPGLGVILGTATVALVQWQAVSAPTSVQVNEIAKQITVMIGGLDGEGSGVIINRQGNTYTVLTAYHVVEKPGGRDLTAPDGQQYRAESSQRLGKLDLALIKFSSSRNYPVAQVADSSAVKPGARVYSAGFPVPSGSNVQERRYFFIPAQMSERGTGESDLLLTGQPRKGVSGGPILNAWGFVIGIYGQQESSRYAKGVRGIPIEKIPNLESIAAVVPWANPTLLATLTGHSDLVESVAISPDGRTLASGSWDNTIKLWNLQTQREIATLTGHSSYVSYVAISPDGRTLASGSWDNTIKLWNLQIQREIATLMGYLDSNLPVAFSPDGRTLAIGNGSMIKLWNLQTQQQIATLTGYSSSVLSLAISPDSRTLVSGSLDDPIKLWNLQTQQQIANLTGHSTSYVPSVAISPDGRTLASVSYDNTIKLWNLQTQQQIATLTGHSDSVNSVAFSPDGRTLASGSRDKTIKLWNLQTQQEFATLTGNSEAVNSVAFSPDGRTLASGSTDKTIKLWQDR